MTGKCGEADNIQREPAMGTTNTDAAGRRWRKVRRLGREAWGKALTNAEFDRRIGLPITDEHLQAMGYELAP